MHQGRQSFLKRSVHEVREHLKTAGNAAIGQEMILFKPI
jgi:hypothetical protein